MQINAMSYYIKPNNSIYSRVCTLIAPSRAALGFILKTWHATDLRNASVGRNDASVTITRQWNNNTQRRKQCTDITTTKMQDWHKLRRWKLVVGINKHRKHTHTQLMLQYKPICNMTYISLKTSTPPHEHRKARHDETTHTLNVAGNLISGSLKPTNALRAAISRRSWSNWVFVEDTSNIYTYKHRDSKANAPEVLNM